VNSPPALPSWPGRPPLASPRCRPSRLAGLFNPAAREMIETQYQWQRPFVLDSTAATVAFGIDPRPTDEALRETIAGLRAPVPA
jgi:hypothetical protein